jgi:uncharacterized membrane-anchored protein YjiN (DUF445 family)
MTPAPLQGGSQAPDGASPFTADEAAGRRTLSRNRLLATGLLFVMAAVYAATWLDRTPGVWMGLVRSASEAGIVGGVADWFAVTAIFRHPFGIPTPHTAVLPRSKDRIGRALGTFVERGFLTEAVVLPRLRAMQPARRMALWLAKPANAPVLVGPVISAAPNVVRALDNPEVREFLNRLVSDRLREANLAPLLGRSLEVLTHSGEADLLFDRVLEAALAWAEEKRPDFDRLVQERSSWWIPRALNRHIAHKLFAGVADLLKELQNHDSEARREFHATLDRLIDRLINSPEQAAELSAARDRLLSRPELGAWIGAVWTELSEALVRDAASPDSHTRAVLERAVALVGQELRRDERLQARLDETIEQAALRILAHRGEIARFMAEVVRSWDADTVSQRLEQVIGSDLQYIRINGAVVGALTGSVIFLITRLVA